MTNNSKLGTSVHHNRKTEIDGKNIGPGKNEIERITEFPRLTPGHALLDIEEGVIVEFGHPLPGSVRTVEGRQTGGEEYLNAKYRTRKGQDWGGIIEQYHIAYAKHLPDEPNEHNEISVPTTLPEFTNAKPETFRENVLQDQNGRPKPFLLLERPEISYEEVSHHDTYDIIGWYDQQADKNNRVKPIESLTTKHPEINGENCDRTTYRVIDSLDIHIKEQQINRNQNQYVSANSGELVENKASIHITTGRALESFAYLIESPFESKEDIKNLSLKTRWIPELEQWAVIENKSVKTLSTIINSLTTDQQNVTIESHLFLTHASKRSVLDDNDDLSETTIDDIYKYAFNTSTADIPHLGTIEVHGTTEDPTACSLTDNELVDEPSENHITNIEDNTCELVCPRDSASIVKSLNYSEANYAWNSDKGVWTVNADSIDNLVEAFENRDKQLTIDIDNITLESSVHTENVETEDDKVTSDNNKESITNNQDNDAPKTALGHTNNNNASLEQLALILNESSTAENFQINLCSLNIPELSETVKKEWTANVDDSNERYEFYNSNNQTYFIVEKTSKFGEELALSISDQVKQNKEHIVTVSSEKKMVGVLIDHIKALN